MDSITLYYSVSNGGDGSAYPQWFESEDLADWHQETFCEEDWGESCTGSITVNGNMLSCSSLATKESEFIELAMRFGKYGTPSEEDERILTEFGIRFFEEGAMPGFHIHSTTTTRYNDHHYLVFKIDGQTIKYFAERRIGIVYAENKLVEVYELIKEKRSCYV